jgi:hypothetical protein
MNARMDELEQWKCKNGHMLGVVERVKVDNSQGGPRYIRRLILFRHAIDLSQPSPEEVDVIGLLEGSMLYIRCDVEGCGKVRPWKMGADVLERILETLGASPTPGPSPFASIPKERGQAANGEGRGGLR